MATLSSTWTSADTPQTKKPPTTHHRPQIRNFTDLKIQLSLIKNALEPNPENPSRVLDLTQIPYVCNAAYDSACWSDAGNAVFGDFGAACGRPAGFCELPRGACAGACACACACVRACLRSCARFAFACVFMCVSCACARACACAGPCACTCACACGPAVGTIHLGGAVLYSGTRACSI